MSTTMNVEKITSAGSPTTRPHPRGMTRVQRQAWNWIGIGSLLALMTLLAIIFLSPLMFVVTSSLKSSEQMADPSRPVLPMSPETFAYQGAELPLYNVPIDGVTRQLALLQSRRSGSTFIDPANPDAGIIESPLRAAALTRVMRVDPNPEIYQNAIERMQFPRALVNTLAITILGTIGGVSSAAMVAYGFSRFRIPGVNIIFIVLMATIMLPPQVTLIPMFIFFANIGWVNTLLPLIIPHFFSNAYNVFLLRQYFMTIPVEMDEAARVDGATPLQTFLYIILPQAVPALLTITLLHFLALWNEFYMAFIYTQGSRDAQPLSVALQRFQSFYGGDPNQQMAASLLTMIVPILLFFLAQRRLMQGIVLTGVEK
jgi:multiple sugar transport system permease protein